MSPSFFASAIYPSISVAVVLRLNLNVLSKLGFMVERVNISTLKFEYKGSVVLLYPYTGWFTGKTVNDGRGIKNLIKQLTKEV